MRIKYLLLPIVTALALSGCATVPETTLTPLEIQSLQTREFESNKETVFRSVISVFQDIGYTITNADLETGLISAESSADSGDFASAFLLGITQVKQTKATAFVEQIGDRTTARVNFVEVNKTSSAYGQSNRQDTPLLDAQLYQNAFEKIENAIFIRSQS